jgi:molecular chaperone GrpE
MTEPKSETPVDPASPPDAGAPSEIEQLQARLAAAEQKAQEAWDRHLRSAAELENVRRRTERDAAVGQKYALERVMAELILVNDSLEQGLRAADGKPDAKALLEGVLLTQRQLWATLERHGVSVIDPAGQPFDPSLHEAVSTVESADVPPNRVIRVMQKGYKLHDRLLRPAMVVVARAPTTVASGQHP